MTTLNKQALRGQSVEGSFYLAECGHCGEMYPSNKLDGGEPLFSGDYGECFCHLCGADDSDIADNGAWSSEAVTAWNYQQKRIEALLDELEAAQHEKDELQHGFIANQEEAHEAIKYATELKEQLARACAGREEAFSEVDEMQKSLDHTHRRRAIWRGRAEEAQAKLEAAERRIAELEAREVTLPDRKSIQFWPGDASEFDSLGYEIAVKNALTAAGIGVKGE